MTSERVLELLAALESAGVVAVVDGGWGIDALLGRQTRPHEDLDLVVSLADVERIRSALAAAGFFLAEDHLPVRFVLRNAAGEQLDFHTVTFDEQGGGVQPQPGGGSFRYPPEGFVRGVIGSQVVGCISAPVQVLCHLGYAPTAKDTADILSLCRGLGLPVPQAYESLRAASVDSRDAASQFYTGLVADLYEPLASLHAQAADYVRFLDRSGTPALELACGSGLPLVELVERGYEVHGLDSSQEMLDRCRARAAERGVDVTVHLGEMQSFSLSRRYRSIFLAGASFTLLTTDADAASALERIHTHLEPGGSVLIPLEIPDLGAIRKALGRVREVATAAGDRLRVSMLALEASADGRTVCHRLRYERIPAIGEPEIVERDWKKRWWSQARFREMLRSAGFDDVTFRSATGGHAEPDESVFVALARRAPA